MQILPERKVQTQTLMISVFSPALGRQYYPVLRDHPRDTLRALFKPVRQLRSTERHRLHAKERAQRQQL